MYNYVKFLGAKVLSYKCFVNVHLFLQMTWLFQCGITGIVVIVCQAVLCRFDAAGKMAMPIPLTKDHNATLYDERKRIQKAGGKVM